MHEIAYSNASCGSAMGRNSCCVQKLAGHKSLKGLTRRKGVVGDGNRIVKGFVGDFSCTIAPKCKDRDQ